MPKRYTDAEVQALEAEVKKLREAVKKLVARDETKWQESKDQQAELAKMLNQIEKINVLEDVKTLQQEQLGMFSDIGILKDENADLKMAISSIRSGTPQTWTPNDANDMINKILMFGGARQILDYLLNEILWADPERLRLLENAPSLLNLIRAIKQNNEYQDLQRI